MKKINHLKEKQEAIKNKASRDYENRGRELERLEEQVNSINEELGIDNSYLSSSSASEKLDSTKAKKKEETSSKFIDAANIQIAKLSQKSYNSIDPIEQLTKLASLLEKGLLTQEEFDLKKKELLGLKS
jgi:hypothetical protein